MFFDIITPEGNSFYQVKKLFYLNLSLVCYWIDLYCSIMREQFFFFQGIYILTWLSIKKVLVWPCTLIDQIIQQFSALHCRDWEWCLDKFKKKVQANLWFHEKNYISKILCLVFSLLVLFCLVFDIPIFVLYSIKTIT